MKNLRMCLLFILSKCIWSEHFRKNQNSNVTASVFAQFLMKRISWPSRAWK